uniref:DUF1995 domain-containing protein n=1 Tax=Chromera velia CCMP2878 TaxID=1169474 RepID=A0A0G4HLW4_9ALVE|eukprot:Cvel_28925.t1-p1 / transcript=Cvel_28925.t1 / gene=Cvel_28925 / organism=Chromera_velia_CCMP2878 / gene_product=hypothetical protein / transcript_product=hypothetical protein / location=Cvel_scaffold3872:3550-12688(+) / protein_length=1757 / sequence_SO=supercontig / SO=protein_coding / is_pseudo=false
MLFDLISLFFLSSLLAIGELGVSEAVSGVFALRSFASRGGGQKRLQSGFLPLISPRRKRRFSNSSSYTCNTSSPSDIGKTRGISQALVHSKDDDDSSLSAETGSGSGFGTGDKEVGSRQTGEPPPPSPNRSQQQSRLPQQQQQGEEGAGGSEGGENESLKPERKRGRPRKITGPLAESVVKKGAREKDGGRASSASSSGKLSAPRAKGRPRKLSPHAKPPPAPRSRALETGAAAEVDAAPAEDVSSEGEASTTEAEEAEIEAGLTAETEVDESSSLALGERVETQEGDKTEAEMETEGVAAAEEVKEGGEEGEEELSESAVTVEKHEQEEGDSKEEGGDGEKGGVSSEVSFQAEVLRQLELLREENKELRALNKKLRALEDGQKGLKEAVESVDERLNFLIENTREEEHEGEEEDEEEGDETGGMGEDGSDAPPGIRQMFRMMGGLPFLRMTGMNLAPELLGGGPLEGGLGSDVEWANQRGQQGSARPKVSFRDDGFRVRFHLPGDWERRPDKEMSNDQRAALPLGGRGISSILPGDAIEMTLDETWAMKQIQMPSAFTGGGSKTRISAASLWRSLSNEFGEGGSLKSPFGYGGTPSSFLEVQFARRWAMRPEEDWRDDDAIYVQKILELSEDVALNEMIGDGEDSETEKEREEGEDGEDGEFGADPHELEKLMEGGDAHSLLKLFMNQMMNDPEGMEGFRRIKEQASGGGDRSNVAEREREREHERERYRHQRRGKGRRGGSAIPASLEEVGEDAARSILEAFLWGKRRLAVDFHEAPMGSYSDSSDAVRLAVVLDHILLEFGAAVESFSRRGLQLSSPVGDTTNEDDELELEGEEGKDGEEENSESKNKEIHRKGPVPLAPSPNVKVRLVFNNFSEMTEIKNSTHWGGDTTFAMDTVTCGHVRPEDRAIVFVQPRGGDNRTESMLRSWLEQAGPDRIVVAFNPSTEEGLSPRAFSEFDLAYSSTFLRLYETEPSLLDNGKRERGLPGSTSRKAALRKVKKMKRLTVLEEDEDEEEEKKKEKQREQGGPFLKPDNVWSFTSVLLREYPNNFKLWAEDPDIENESSDGCRLLKEWGPSECLPRLSEEGAVQRPNVTEIVEALQAHMALMKKKNLSEDPERHTRSLHPPALRRQRRAWSEFEKLPTPGKISTVVRLWAASGPSRVLLKEDPDTANAFREEAPSRAPSKTEWLVRRLYGIADPSTGRRPAPLNRTALLEAELGFHKNDFDADGYLPFITEKPKTQSASSESDESSRSEELPRAPGVPPPGWVVPRGYYRNITMWEDYPTKKKMKPPRAPVARLFGARGAPFMNSIQDFASPVMLQPDGAEHDVFRCIQNLKKAPDADRVGRMLLDGPSAFCPPPGSGEKEGSRPQTVTVLEAPLELVGAETVKNHHDSLLEAAKREEEIVEEEEDEDGEKEARSGMSLTFKGGQPGGSVEGGGGRQGAGPSWVRGRGGKSEEGTAALDGEYEEVEDDVVEEEGGKDKIAEKAEQQKEKKRLHGKSFFALGSSPSFDSSPFEEEEDEEEEQVGDDQKKFTLRLDLGSGTSDGGDADEEDDGEEDGIVEEIEDNKPEASEQKESPAPASLEKEVTENVSKPKKETEIPPTSSLSAPGGMMSSAVRSMLGRIQDDLSAAEDQQSPPPTKEEEEGQDKRKEKTVAEEEEDVESSHSPPPCLSLLKRGDSPLAGLLLSSRQPGRGGKDAEKENPLDWLQEEEEEEDEIEVEGAEGGMEEADKKPEKGEEGGEGSELPDTERPPR